MTIEQRVERLERSARRWRLGCTASLACLSAVALAACVGAAPDVKDEINARQINVVNEAGEKAVTLTTGDDGSGAVFVQGPHQSQAVSILSTPGGYVGLEVKEPGGEGRIQLLAKKGLGANLTLSTDLKTKTFEIANVGARAKMAINDSSGNVVWSAP
jgi:hypothetical protein